MSRIVSIGSAPLNRDWGRLGRPAMKFICTVAIFALVTATTTAQAAEIKQTGGDISITGIITPGDAAKLKAIAANTYRTVTIIPGINAIAPNSDSTVILDSPGGSVAEAVLIGNQVRSHSYATRVPRR